jgi:iron complex transport system permease protein
MSVLLSLIWGQLSMDVTEVIASITHYFGFMILPDTVPTAQQEAVLWHIRLPRTLVGLLVGASLAASGAVLQGVFSNPLADPGIIGVSSGASVGAIVAIAGGFATAYSLALPAFAFLGAISAMGLAVALSLHHGRIPVMTLLLSGVVVGMFLSAVTAVILTSLSNQQMQQYLFWTIGDLDYRRWEHVFLGVVPISAGIFLMLLMSRQLNVLMLGEVAARAVGMPVMHWRILFLSLAALTTAAAVCISGNIGFVGLVVPHAMRLLVGPDHRRLLPASILAGAAFLVLCDSVGRIILPSSEIRVGIMTAFIGTPYFLYLLRKRRI